MMETAVGRVVVVEEADVLATVGVRGLLEQRLSDAKLIRVGPCRSDLMLQRLVGSTLPSELEIPSSHTSWWEGQRPYGVVPGALYVMSLHSDLVGPQPLVHTSSGFLVDPPAASSGPQWLEGAFAPAPPLSATDTVTNFETMADLLSKSDSQAVILGASTFDPSDSTHHYRDRTDTFGVKTNRVLAGVQTLATGRGWGFVDVDRTVAEIGGLQHVPTPGSFSREAADLITTDAIDVIADHGRFGATLLPPVMTVEIPPIHARTRMGHIDSWRTAAGEAVSKGDVLVRIKFAVTPHNASDTSRSVSRFERWKKKRRQARYASGRTMLVDIIAGADVHLDSILQPAASDVAIGQPVALVTTTPSISAVVEEAEGALRVDVKVVDG